MATGVFPEDPSNRRVVAVLEQHDIERCQYDPAVGQFLSDSEAYVLPFPVPRAGKLPVALRNIVDGGLGRPNIMLVQSPFDPNSYEEATEAPQRFALAKHMYFSLFCRHLGAREVVVEQVEAKSTAGKTTVEVKGNRAGVSAKVGVENEELEKFVAQLSLQDQFSGGKPDLKRAEELLRSTGLITDPNMRTLLEMRRDGTNQLQSRKLVMSLSSETKASLGVLGRLKVPAFVQLSADYKLVASSIQEYTLTLTVNF